MHPELPRESWGSPRARCSRRSGSFYGQGSRLTWAAGFTPAPRRTSAADILSNTSAGEIKQSSHGGQAGQQPALNIPPAHSQALQ